MTNDMTQSQAGESNPLPPFGMRLQTAREALGIDLKDAAAQLRLNERVISMLETDCYGTDLPPTFVRGYIRSYGKLLQIPENEIKEAIEPIKQHTLTQPVLPIASDETPTVTSSNYFVQLFTYLIVLTLITLVGIWWYTHTAPPVTTEKAVAIPMQAEPQVVTLPATVNNTATSSAPPEAARTKDVNVQNNAAEQTAVVAPTLENKQMAAATIDKTTTNTTKKSHATTNNDDDNEDDEE